MALSTTITVENGELFGKLADQHIERLSVFGELLNVQALSSMLKRLSSTYDPDGYRTGLLSASLTPGHPQNVKRFTKGGAQTAIAEAGSSVEYAAQQDQGGPIFPNPPRRLLAIPLDDKVKRSLASPSDLDPNREILTFIEAKDGRLYLIDETGKLGFGKGPLFVLVPEVFTPPKHFTDDASVLREIADAVPDIYSEFLGLTL